MKFKAATYNILHCENHLTGKIDFDGMVQTINSFDADFVGLNEVHAKGEDAEYDNQTGILSAGTGMNGFFAKAVEIDGANPFGNAALTRFDIESARVIPVPDPVPPAYDGYYETRCLLKIKTVSPALTFLVIHFGLNPDEQENALKVVLDNMENEKCILMGDFNMKPDDAFLEPIKARMNDTAEFISGSGFTFPSHAPNRKIDYIFVTPDIKILSCRVDCKIQSDHLPVIAELED